MGALPKLIVLPKPQAIDYHDYREFFKSWFAYLESGDPNFSLRALARDAKISVSNLSMMLNGHRSLTKSAFEKLRPFLRLDENELEYIELLWELAEAPTPESRDRVLSRIQKRKDYRARHPKEFETFNYLSHWYFVAIREMAALPGFKANARWIHARLRGQVSLEEIEQALNFLIAHGFITADQAGALPKQLDCMGGVFRLALGKFHREMLKHLGESIEDVSRDQRYLLGHTFAVTAENFSEARKVLDEALKKLEALSAASAANQESAQNIYHVVLGLAPLTKGVSDDE
jgi:uncharacterized protein (TIGR02147 family)